MPVPVLNPGAFLQDTFLQIRIFHPEWLAMEKQALLDHDRGRCLGPYVTIAKGLGGEYRGDLKRRSFGDRNPKIEIVEPFQQLRGQKKISL